MLKAVFDNSSSQYAFASTNGIVNIGAASNTIAQLAVAGLDLAAIYLTIKADILLFIAAAAESLAHTLGK